MSEEKKEEKTEGLSKNALKKLEKEKKKEEMKKQRAAERAAKQAAEKGPAKETSDVDHSKIFGVPPLIRSETREGKNYVQMGQIGEKFKEGDTILVRGRVDNVRGKGNLCFVVLRQRVSTIQCVIAKSNGLPKEMIKFAMDLAIESIVDIQGKLVKAEQKVDSCTIQELELQPETLFVISKADTLPILVTDCSVKPAVFEEQKKAQAVFQKEIDALIAQRKEGERDDELEAKIEKLTEQKATMSKLVKIKRNKRLDHRIIDLRTRANNAIFRIQSAVGTLFREFLLTQDFVEIHSPKTLGQASEGGASVFKFPYFETQGCLAQSPQLYKQMCIAADFGRVFEVGPVFRAEKSFTRRHLCEFMGLDMEMAFNEHYYEVTEMIGNMFCYIFDNIPKRFPKELEAINDQYPFKPLRYQNPPLRFDWPQIVKLLRDDGDKDIGDFSDIGTEQETRLGQIIAEKYDTDFYWVDKYPSDERPFYTMPDPKDERYSNSYDWFVRGWEITSGAQRIHDPELLTKRATVKGVDPETIKDYIDSFRYGCSPHGGCGVGLERLVMLYLGLKNIRMSSLFPRDPKRLAP